MNPTNETSLRGTRLGATSYENEIYAEFAERLYVRYECEHGHTTVVPFSVEAEEIPVLWECRCGSTALQAGADLPEPEPTRHIRTHWDMLLERRTIADLEALLSERLELLHTGALETKRSA